MRVLSRWEGAGLFAQRVSAIFLSEVKSPLVAPLVSLTNRIRQNRLTVITNCFANRMSEGGNRGLVRAAEPLWRCILAISQCSRGLAKEGIMKRDVG